MNRAKVKKLEQGILGSTRYDPYKLLTIQELDEVVKAETRRIHKDILKKEGKAAAEEYWKLFIEHEDTMERPYHPSVNNKLSYDERIELLKKQTEWKLSRTEDEEYKEKIMESYESDIEFEEKFR
jgi:hypothetical protein